MKKIVVCFFFLLFLSYSFTIFDFTDVLADTSEGMSFSIDGYYQVEEKFNKYPETIEAEIYVPETIDEPAGVIFGNYGAGPSISLDIQKYGEPRFYLTDSSGSGKSLIFSTDIRGKWSHISIVRLKEESRTLFYLNGELVEKMLYYDYDSKVLNNKFVIGGDYRGGNTGYFKGKIRSISIYSDARTDEEIKSDYSNGADLNDDNLLANFSLNDNINEKIKDNSKNEYKTIYNSVWLDDINRDYEYEYSFAVVGDTQYTTDRYPQQLPKIYDWILDKKDEKKIQHVFGLGDITDRDSKKEWETAYSAISKMDGKISYSLVRGNHDSTKMFNKTFNNEAYKKQFEGFYSEYIDTSYMLFTVCETDYLFITLDYGASDEELQWAAEKIKMYPNHRVIITTHGYLNYDGTTLDSKDGSYPSDLNDKNDSPDKVYNTGEDMWNKLISKHANIFMVISGHIDYCDIVSSKREGIHGNTVVELLIDPQALDSSGGAMGLVAMLYFSKDGSNFSLEYYSTIHNKYYSSKNQFTIDEITYKTSHEYGEWEIVKEATTEECGIKQAKCICGEYIQEEIAMLDKPSGGCSGSVISTMFSLQLLILVAYVYKKKKLN